MEGFNSSWQNVEGNGNQNREEVPAAAATSAGNENYESSDDQQEIQPGGAASSSRRVQYNRHTPEQIEELEKLFKKNPHPNEKQRSEIGRKLNIEMRKVKFWFQNRRTQLKTQTERHENAILKQENEHLKLENLAMKEAVKNPFCNKCGGHAMIPERSIQDQKLLIDNARLKEELSSMTNIVNQLLGRPSSLANQLPKKMIIPNDTSATEELSARGSYNYATLNPMEARSQMGFDMPIQRNGYLEQASKAMEELLKLGLVNAPLWTRNMEGGGETLNFEEYVRAFPPCLGTKPLGFVSEATRASSVVSMTSSALVEALLSAHQWREMFVGMVGSCTTLEVISNGIGGSRNGALQLMKAEIQLISPLVPVRVVNFIRFTKQQAEGVWTVVDLSTGAGVEAHLTRRRPSGCIIHDMPNGFSTVTWIEHTEYDEQLVSQQYRQLIRSGVGFGAQRWISALLRHCEGLRATMSPTLNHHLSLDTKRSLKGLAQRMASIFCAGVCLSGGQQWDLVMDAPGRPRIMARKCVNGLGEPFGIIATATYSVWIAAQHRHLFDMLLTRDLRCVWDVMFHNIASGSMIHFPLGQDDTSPNCISILSSNETVSDMTGSLIVYATVDIPTVSVVMNGADTSSVALLPSGLCIVPGYGEWGAPGGERGSMVTREDLSKFIQYYYFDSTSLSSLPFKMINFMPYIVGGLIPSPSCRFPNETGKRDSLAVGVGTEISIAGDINLLEAMMLVVGDYAFPDNPILSALTFPFTSPHITQLDYCDH
ncbi:hypothetical protein L1987_35648 [Smallanthus sonchifolius]|uniref:Uncharacterized protein n=1 Tax=Smallanthus sonchifolius TaxID=185202 RepID=A0ACB9HCH7_9ASTR|nr:hypothetical protein L1987_35648 [Smallanthus sonchifolius]